MTSAKLGAWRIAALMLVFVWFFVGGIGHFAWTNTFVSVVPNYIPLPRLAVLGTGAAEIIGALALLSATSRQYAGWMLMFLCVCFLPVHIDMLQHAERYPQFGPGVLWARLLFQPLYICIIWFATAPPRVQLSQN